MSELFNEKFPGILAAYVNDTRYTLDNSECKELSKFVEGLTAEVAQLTTELAAVTAERDALLDEQAQQIFTLTGNAAEISGKLTQAWIDLNRVTAENQSLREAARSELPRKRVDIERRGMTTVATLFSGFEGVGIGAKAAGITHLWGIEWRDDVAEVARGNGFHSITADILAVDPHDLERVDFLHASPPCTNASTANSKAGESEGDKALAYKTAQFVEVLRPEVFTLENVWGYRKFDSFKFILTTLERLGYWIDVQHVNAADFGVPQSRRRMILRARMGGWIPNMPDPVRWVGWYEAIEDLIPTLPESKFAPWQLSRLPKEYKDTFLIGATSSNFAINLPDRPSCTVMSSAKTMPPRAFLANTNMSGDDGDGMQVQAPDEPAFSVTQSADGRLRAFPVNTREAHGVGEFGVRQADEPAETYAATTQPERFRAFLVNGQNAGRDLSIKEISDPAMVVTANAQTKGLPRCYTTGRVVSMTPRALARFQSFPDWYELPARKSLACFGIGNAVPPLLMQRIYEQLKGES